MFRRKKKSQKDKYEISDLNDDPEYADYISNQFAINSDLKKADMKPMKVKGYDEWKRDRWG